jgi:hypothetical protein
MDWTIKQIGEELAARLEGGPLRFRLILQPAVATYLGIHAGLRDASIGAPPFLWSLVSSRVGRMEKLREIRRALWRPILFATLVDATVQFLMFGHVHPLIALQLGSALMALPYSAARGIANRIRSGRIRSGPRGHRLGGAPT